MSQDSRISKLRVFLRTAKDLGCFTSFKVEKRWVGGRTHQISKYVISVSDAVNSETMMALKRMIEFFVPGAINIYSSTQLLRLSSPGAYVDSAAIINFPIRVSDANVAKVFKKLQSEFTNPNVSKEDIDLILKTYL